MNVLVIGGTLGVAWVAFVLLVAAITFAVAANVTKFRQSAISAPMVSLILAPCMLRIAIPPILRHAFIVQNGLSSRAIYGLVVVLFIAACAILAKAATLACRDI